MQWEWSQGILTSVAVLDGRRKGPRGLLRDIDPMATVQPTPSSGNLHRAGLSGPTRSCPAARPVMETLPPRGGVAVEARIAHDLVVEDRKSTRLNYSH